jgi:hypothetical protein
MRARQRLVHLSDPQCEEHIECAHQQMEEAPAIEMRTRSVEGDTHMEVPKLGHCRYVASVVGALVCFVKMASC